MPTYLRQVRKSIPFRPQWRAPLAGRMPRLFSRLRAFFGGVLLAAFFLAPSARAVSPTPLPSVALPDCGCNNTFVFPHPLKAPGGWFAYNMEKDGVVKATVMTLRGRTAMVFTEPRTAVVGTTTSFLNIGDLQSGIYLLLVEMDYNDGTSKRLNPYKLAVQR